MYRQIFRSWREVKLVMATQAYELRNELIWGTSKHFERCFRNLPENLNLNFTGDLLTIYLTVIPHQAVSLPCPLLVTSWRLIALLSRNFDIHPGFTPNKSFRLKKTTVCNEFTINSGKAVFDISSGEEGSIMEVASMIQEDWRWTKNTLLLKNCFLNALQI